MADLNSFVTTYTGIPVDVDGVFGPQCWDLAELWAHLNGVPQEPWAVILGPTGSAKEAWTCFEQSSHMQKYYTKQTVGQPGDLAVYNSHGAYTEGHIAVYIGNGQVFEQNADPDGSLPHVYKRATTYLFGFLRINAYAEGGDMPNSGDVINVYQRINHKQPTDEEIAAYTAKSWSAPDGLYYGKVDIDLANKDADIQAKQKQIDDLTALLEAAGTAPQQLKPGTYLVS